MWLNPETFVPFCAYSFNQDDLRRISPVGQGLNQLNVKFWNLEMKDDIDQTKWMDAWTKYKGII